MKKTALEKVHKIIEITEDAKVALAKTGRFVVQLDGKTHMLGLKDRETYVATVVGADGVEVKRETHHIDTLFTYFMTATK